MLRRKRSYIPKCLLLEGLERVCSLCKVAALERLNCGNQCGHQRAFLSGSQLALSQTLQDRGGGFARSNHVEGQRGACRDGTADEQSYPVCADRSGVDGDFALRERRLVAVRKPSVCHVVRLVNRLSGDGRWSRRRRWHKRLQGDDGRFAVCCDGIGMDLIPEKNNFRQ